MSEKIIPFPVSSIRDQVMRKLDEVDARAVILAIDGALVGESGASAKLTVMGRNADGSWSFAGWLALSTRPVKDTEFGFEIRKQFGG